MGAMDEAYVLPVYGLRIVSVDDKAVVHVLRVQRLAAGQLRGNGK
jgi:hypothetical protein